jgi:hypothetical protein
MRLPATSPARSLAVAACCALTCWVWWSSQLPQRSGEPLFGLNSDAFFYTVPALRYGARVLRHGALPLWDPYQQCGTAFLAAQHHGLLYPSNWLVLFLPVTTALRLGLLLHYALAMGGAYWCARTFGISTPAALLAGVGYAFSGALFNLGTAQLPGLLISAAWLPVQLGCTRAFLVRDRWLSPAIGLGIATAMVFLGGHPQYVLIAGQLCGVYLLAHLIRHRLRRSLLHRATVGGLVGAAVAVGLSAVQLLPMTELMLRSPRRPGAIAGGGNLLFSSWLSTTQFFHSILLPLGPLGNTADGHVATILIILAAIPLVSPATRRRAVFLWVIGAAAALVAMGESGRVYHWYLLLPGSDWFRFPVRLMAVTALCLSLLGGLGADVLRNEVNRRRATIAAALGIGLLVLAHVVASQSIAELTGILNAQRLPLLVAITLVVLLAVPRYPRRSATSNAVVLLAVGASLIELYAAWTVGVSSPANHRDAVPLPTAAAAYITSRQGFDRTFNAVPPFAWGRAVPGVLFKLGMETGIFVVNDNEKLFDSRYAELLELLGNEGQDKTLAVGLRLTKVDLEDIPLLRILGVRFVISDRSAEIAFPWPRPVYQDARYDIYEVADPLPRTYVASRVRAVTTSAASLAVLRDTPGFIVARGAVVETALDERLESSGSSTITRYEPQRVELKVDLAQRGLVVLQDQIDPFWRARVDGRDVPLLRTNHIFRGIVVDAGHHVVELVYRPFLFAIGAVVTLLTVAALCLVATRTYRHRQSSVLSQKYAE